MSRRFSHRIGAALLAGVLLSAVAAPNASAHGFNGQPIPDAAQYLSAITAITPVTPGVSASIDPRGEWISVTNTGADTADRARLRHRSVPAHRQSGVPKMPTPRQ